MVPKLFRTRAKKANHLPPGTSYTVSAIPPEENLVPGPAGEGAGPSGVGHRGGSNGGIRSGVQTAGELLQQQL